jgi:hypothetical protein
MTDQTSAGARAACWANCLGDCAAKISREHPVSKSLYTSDVVVVAGFSWCKNAPKTVGLASLTAKILCERHNSRLSDVDSAGAHAFDAFRQCQGLLNVRGKNPKTRWTIRRFHVDGPRLERWFLKTTINLCHGQAFKIGRDSTECGRPTDELVKIAFGLRSFPGKAGLYSIVRVGQARYSDDSVKFAPLIKDQSYIAGGLFSFRGFIFLLFLEPEGLAQPLIGLSFDGEDLGQCQINFHNKQARAVVGKYLSHVVQTNWH